MEKYLKCIDATKTAASKHFETWVIDKEVYTLRRMGGSLTGEQGVYLVEIKNPPVFIPELGGNVEPSFSLKRFVFCDKLGLEIHEEETEKLAA